MHEALPSSGAVGAAKQFVNVVEDDEHRLRSSGSCRQAPKTNSGRESTPKGAQSGNRALLDELRAEVARAVTGLVRERWRSSLSSLGHRARAAIYQWSRNNVVSRCCPSSGISTPPAISP